MIKALFFDIDGTLVSFDSHTIPQSTINAIARAKSRGLEIYIATGRPRAIIDNIGQIEQYVDGYITANGAFCFIGEREISCSPIAPEDVKAVLRAADRDNFSCMVVGENDFTMHNPTEKAEYIFKDLLNVADMGEKTPLENVLRQRIIQLTPIVDADGEQRLLASLGAVESGRWHPAFADFTAPGVSKAKGLAEIAAARGFAIEETMAFGDGGNDIPIIKAAGIGVAMGNANTELKAVADHITDTIDNSGIEKALVHFRII